MVHAPTRSTHFTHLYTTVDSFLTATASSIPNPSPTRLPIFRTFLHFLSLTPKFDFEIPHPFPWYRLSLFTFYLYQPHWRGCLPTSLQLDLNIPGSRRAEWRCCTLFRLRRNVRQANPLVVGHLGHWRRDQSTVAPHFYFTSEGDADSEIPVPSQCRSGSAVRCRDEKVLEASCFVRDCQPPGRIVCMCVATGSIHSYLFLLRFAWVCACMVDGLSPPMWTMMDRVEAYWHHRA
ncbi:uncharacterized protein EI90DRAFT_442740 [Cantharellus anzutake]|uniref:uncharacterized protein n=1 Tax=Cantharellus anzutake TaxID=1750568 RepID=UPI0019075F5A|nr:uncharacterized protein EI90DRAFT_442740 [Cantharellus anzutake]KAF8334606.1 hypothetical protein EI90DRAFT_442740 [Cantharellus anzutake]